MAMRDKSINLILKKEAYAIIGACMEVYNNLGAGFLESVYQESLAIEFNLRELPHISQPNVSISYKERLLELAFRPDFTCYDQIIVELKAVSVLTGDHRAQVLNYLNATSYRLGLLVNFGQHPDLRWERLVL